MPVHVHGTDTMPSAIKRGMANGRFHHIQRHTITQPEMARPCMCVITTRGQRTGQLQIIRGGTLCRDVHASLSGTALPECSASCHALSQRWNSICAAFVQQLTGSSPTHVVACGGYPGTLYMVLRLGMKSGRVHGGFVGPQNIAEPRAWFMRHVASQKRRPWCIIPAGGPVERRRSLLQDSHFTLAVDKGSFRTRNLLFPNGGPSMGP